jgi:hypothetical protein
MRTPGFQAEHSLYRTSGNYYTFAAPAQAVGATPQQLASPVPSLFGPCGPFGFCCGGGCCLRILGETCCGGVCGSARNGQSCCCDHWTDTNFDARNCGGCGIVCPPGAPECIGGRCQRIR